MQPRAIILAPFGKNGNNLSTKLSNRTYSYSDKFLKNRKLVKVKFALCLVDKDGNRSNWLNKNIVVKRESYDIKLANLEIAKKVLVNRFVKFNFDIATRYPRNDIYINITDGISQPKLIPLNQLNKKWVFRNPGTIKFSLNAVSKIDGVVSNKLVRFIHVIPNFPPPKIDFTTIPTAVNKNLSITYNYSDSKYTDPDDFMVQMIINDSLKVALDPATKVENYKLAKKGKYNVILKVVTRDGRSSLISTVVNVR